MYSLLQLNLLRIVKRALRSPPRPTWPATLHSKIATPLCHPVAKHQSVALLGSPRPPCHSSQQLEKTRVLDKRKRRRNSWKCTPSGTEHCLQLHVKTRARHLSFGPSALPSSCHCHSESLPAHLYCVSK